MYLCFQLSRTHPAGRTRSNQLSNTSVSRLRRRNLCVSDLAFLSPSSLPHASCTYTHRPVRSVPPALLFLSRTLTSLSTSKTTTIPTRHFPHPKLDITAPQALISTHISLPHHLPSHEYTERISQNPQRSLRKQGHVIGQAKNQLT